MTAEPASTSATRAIPRRMVTFNNPRNSPATHPNSTPVTESPRVKPAPAARQPVDEPVYIPRHRSSTITCRRRVEFSHDTDAEPAPSRREHVRVMESGGWAADLRGATAACPSGFTPLPPTARRAVVSPAGESLLGGDEPRATRSADGGGPSPIGRPQMSASCKLPRRRGLRREASALRRSTTAREPFYLSGWRAVARARAARARQLSPRSCSAARQARPTATPACVPRRRRHDARRAPIANRARPARDVHATCETSARRPETEGRRARHTQALGHLPRGSSRPLMARDLGGRRPRPSRRTDYGRELLQFRTIFAPDDRQEPTMIRSATQDRSSCARPFRVATRHGHVWARLDRPLRARRDRPPRPAPAYDAPIGETRSSSPPTETATSGVITSPDSRSSCACSPSPSACEPYSALPRVRRRSPRGSYWSEPSQP